MRKWLERDIDRLSRQFNHSPIPVGKRGQPLWSVADFIGLEMVENLVERGLSVTLIEKLNQVMPPLDTEMARLVERYLAKHNVNVELNDGVAGFQKAKRGLEVLTENGRVLPADIVILAIGVKPETALAEMAGLELGKRGGFQVNDQMITSDPDIFAVGDAVEVKDFVTGQANPDTAGRTGQPPGPYRG